MQNKERKNATELREDQSFHTLIFIEKRRRTLRKKERTEREFWENFQAFEAWTLGAWVLFILNWTVEITPFWSDLMA
jgi:hypothetical protein